MIVPDPEFRTFDQWVSALIQENPESIYPTLTFETAWKDFAAAVTTEENLIVDYSLYFDWKSWARALTEAE